MDVTPTVTGLFLLTQKSCYFCYSLSPLLEMCCLQWSHDLDGPSANSKIEQMFIRDATRYDCIIHNEEIMCSKWGHIQIWIGSGIVRARIHKTMLTILSFPPLFFFFFFTVGLIFVWTLFIRGNKNSTCFSGACVQHWLSFSHSTVVLNGSYESKHSGFSSFLS